MRKKPYRLHPQCRRAFTPLLMALAIGTASLLPADAWAQSVTVNIGQGTLDQAFRQIMKNSKVELVYNTRTVAAIPCDAHRFENQEVSHILDILLRGTDLSYTVQDGIYTIVRRPQPRQHSVQGNVSGVVLDENREPIIGASVLVEGTSQGVITDIDGKKITKMAELQEYLANKRPGDKVTITYLRDKKKKTATLTLKNQQGNTNVVKHADLDVLGGNFREINDEEKQQLNINTGLVVMKVNNGVLKDAGINRGFIIQKVNDEPMKTIADLQKAVKDASTSKDPVLYIQGIYPTGKKAYFAVPLQND